MCFFFNDTATTEIYTLSLHDALPILTVTTCCGENVLDEIGYKFLYKPIDERINKVCSLALNWVKLKLMDNKDKKVAIILHNMPPRNDMIGSAYGLDSPKSVFNMVNALDR